MNMNNTYFYRLKFVLIRMVFALASCFASNGFAQSTSAWPKIALPESAEAYAVGNEMNVNGMPMRVQGFESKLKTEQLAKWFRKSLGEPLVESPKGSKLVLGRAEKDYYLTIQLEPSSTGTRGLVAVTNLKVAADNATQNKQNMARWADRMPSGSKVASQMSSEDNGKLSNHIVISNLQTESLNAERLKSVMRDDGYEFEREGVADEAAAARMPVHASNGKILFFKGPNKEAVATINRDATGRTAIMLNTITQVERLR
jgi:hypothetical protein